LAEWCNGLLEEGADGEESRFWAEALAAQLLDPEPLPPPPAAALGFEPARVPVVLDAAALAGIDALCRAAGCERRDAFLAAWAALLWRLNGAEDYALGVWSDGRAYEELRQCLGLLGKTLPLAVRCDAQRSMTEFATAVASARSAVESRQEHLDWQKLRGADNGTLGSSWLRSAFSHVSADWREQIGNVAFTLEDVASHDRPFALKLAVVETARGPRADLWFDATAVVRAGAERLAGRLIALLGHLADEPDTSVGNLPVLAAEDQTAIAANLRVVGEPVADSAPCVIARFRELAAQRPAAPAVSCGDTTLTYAELDDRATRLAAFLRTQGVDSNTAVAVCMRRSTDAIVAILGIMRAGAAYVPVDPEYPAARIAFVLEDSGSAVLLTQAALAATLPPLSAEIVCIDRDAEHIARASAEVVLPAGAPEQLAYLLYTSGSTGKPKGVQVTRGNLAYSTAARFAYYGEAPGVFLLLSSFAFDSSVAGIFWTLTGGGHLVISAGDGAIDAAEVARAMSRHGVTHTLCLPSVYGMLLDTVPAAALRSLEVVIVAGESCPPSIVEKHRRSRPGTRLFNEYGPTECTVWSTAYECRGEEPAGTAVSIGRAIPGAAVAVLGPDSAPVPVGCKGELYVTGPGLTVGYHGRPDLTRERYVEVELPLLGRRRAYRTGDLVRLRADGNLDFIGRRDFQVKINGYRIELEEVESTIRSQRSVTDAVVVIRKTAAGDPQLAAFVRLSSGAKLLELEAALPTALPRYMIPATLTAVEDFPRTPNGKVDRNALAAMSAGDAESRYVAPRDPFEDLQAEIWAELLGRDRVSVEDDFFRLGGHSILATRLIARFNDVTQLSAPIRTLFEHPTIAKFTDALRRDAKLGAGVARVEAVLAQVADAEAESG
jgi:amino acid adenylation domain-containing protein